VRQAYSSRERVKTTGGDWFLGDSVDHTVVNSALNIM
jgi:hypothetical protein